MEIFCPKCRQKYNVPDSSAGKQAKCKNPVCGQTFTIAAPAQSAPPTASSLFDELPPSPLDNLPQTEAAPAMPTYRPPAKKKSSAPLILILGGGIAALLVLVVVIVVIASGGGGGSSVTKKSVAPWNPLDYLPENAKWIACADMDQVRSTGLYAEVRKRYADQMKSFDSDVDFENVGKIMATSNSGDQEEVLVVLRMNIDCDQKDVLMQGSRSQQQIQNMEGYEYVKGNNTNGKEYLIAQIDARTFCIVPKLDMLQRSLKQLKSKERATLSPGLKKALDTVSNSAIYFAGVDVEFPSPMNPTEKTKIDCFFGSVSLSSGLGVNVTLSFADEAAAKQFKQTIDGLLMMTMMMPPEVKKEIEPILSALKINQEGKEVRIEASWPEEVIKKAIENSDKFKQPSGFPAAPPGMPATPPGFPGGGPG